MFKLLYKIIKYFEKDQKLDFNIYNLSKQIKQDIKSNNIQRIACITSEIIYSQSKLDYWYINITNQKFYNYSNLVFSIVTINDITYLTFKGSNSLNDFITDLNIDDTDFLQGKVHKGTLDLIEPFFENIIYLLKNKSKIIITGHSLGGGLATLMYLYIKEYYKFNVLLITFGCYHLLNKPLTKQVEGLNYVYQSDIVTKIPFNFHHLKNRIQLNKKKLIPSIKDHSLINYYNYLI